MPQPLIIILVALGSYLIGNINFATLITKLKKQDIRKVGSGNPGTMNMLRNFGKALGTLTLFLDILKGVIPCLLGWFLIGGIGFTTPGAPLELHGIFLTGGSRLGLYIAGLSVIIGHVFPVFMRFKGGKGIATAIGICWVAQPILAPITLVLGVLFVVTVKIGSIGSFLIISAPLAVEGFCVSRMCAVAGQYPPAAIASLMLIFLLFSLTLFTHRKNIIKLFSGTESKTVLFGKKKKVATK